MAEGPWITIIGLGEDGPDGLSPASARALAGAEIVMGPARHLALVPEGAQERITWPVPFADGIALLRGFEGRKVAVLASGDPFWFGAGAVIARSFPRAAWHALPGASCFSLVASELGWPLEGTTCLGLHAAPLARMRPHLGQDQRLIVTLRDGDAVAEAMAYLCEVGFGASEVSVFEAVGGPRARVRTGRADEIDGDFAAPVCLAIQAKGEGMPRASGKPDALFETDGVMTKRPMRALTLSALAPRAGEHLWDIGGGSGSIAIEWLMSDPSLSATSIEPRNDRAALIKANAQALGQDRLSIVVGTAPEVLSELARPDVVFVGGGLSPELLEHLFETLPMGTRLVANAVTLDSEALLAQWHSARGGDLMRFEIAQAARMGPETAQRRGWKAAYPVVQWSVVL